MQCRKAAKGVTDLLKSWAEFCLLETSSYIRFLRDEKDQPISFYVIRVTSKPPCFVVWLAFLGGTPGSLRHAIYQELVAKLQALTITQRVCWRDLPSHRIKVQEEDSSGAEDGSSSEAEAKTKAAVSRGFSEVFACVKMTKPVERILVRYDKTPSDFCSLLGPFPSRAHSPMARGPETPRERGQRNAAAAFLTLSRYISHQRWIWTVQSCPSTPLSTAAISRVLNTLCKLRLHEGFAFAHSTNGIQNMVMEVPLSGPAGAPAVGGREAQTCVLQFIIFPPHTTSTAMEDSICEDEEEERQEEGSEEEGEVQIITELWTEPQTGRVLGSIPTDLEFIKGLGPEDISSRFFPKDLECVSTLVTFEHLCLMCQNPTLASPPANMANPTNLPSPPPNDQSGSSDVPRLSPLASNTTIRHIPFAFDLLSLLPKSHQTELLFSLLVQDLSSSYSWYPSHKPFADRPNEMVFEQLFSELSRVSDREVALTPRDHRAIPDLIRARQTERFRFKSTSSTSVPATSSPTTPQQRPSVGRRNPSGASAATTSSTGESGTYRDSIHLPDHLPDHLYPSAPKWRCFVKAVSPTHLVLTLLPASFHDLKALVVTEEVMAASSSSTYVSLVSKPLGRGEEEDCEALDTVSINSSVSHLETFPLEAPTPSPMEARRQRSGSDVFEMTRPKPPTVRKTSGDAVVMRDRTSSLDGFSQFKAKAVLKNLSQLTEAGGDRNRCKSMDSKPLGEAKTTKASKATSGAAPSQAPCSTPKSPWPLHNPAPPKYGSVALPIYVYDCSVAGLTTGLLYRGRADPPRNFYQDHLFQQEARGQGEEGREEEARGREEKGGEEEARPAEPAEQMPESCEFHHREETTGHVDREIKQRCHVLQMIYFKSFVSVLFRCLQLNLPVHSYDVQHSMDYCDNESSLELDLEPFIQAVCGHREHVTQSRAERTVTRDTDLAEVEHASATVLDTDRLKVAKPCSKSEAVHRATMANFQDILGGQFKVVPSHPDLFFFCPPGLDIGSLDTSGRRRNETRSTDGGGKGNLLSGSSGRLRSGLEEEEERTIEFRSELDEYSIKLAKQDSRSEGTDAETGGRECGGHSNMSIISQLETESEVNKHAHVMS